MHKDEMIKAIHKLYRHDTWLCNMFEAIGISADDMKAEIDGIVSDLFFDTAREDAVRVYEKELGINPTTTQSLSDRRSTIMAKWRSTGKCDLAMIQAVAGAWRNGEVAVGFVNGAIKLTFDGAYGVPDDLATLINAIGEIKPAHLAMTYVFKYLLIKDVGTITLTALETHEIKEFAGGVMNV